MNLSIYCDGGSRGNPGEAASAFIVFDQNQQLVFQQGFLLGQTTNNQAEYQAVVAALSWLQSQPNNLQAVNFYLDSLLVVNQINGKYRIKDTNLKQKYLQIIKILDQLKLQIKFIHIPRSNNFRADALVNSTLDSL